MDLDNLMQQAKKIQEQMQKSHQEVANTEVTGEAGAGLVKVLMNGRYDVKQVLIDPSLSNEDIGVLQDLLAAAFNDAVQRVEKINKSSFANLAEGITLPTEPPTK